MNDPRISGQNITGIGMSHVAYAPSAKKLSNRGSTIEEAPPHVREEAVHTNHAVHGNGQPLGNSSNAEALNRASEATHLIRSDSSSPTMDSSVVNEAVKVNHPTAPTVPEVNPGPIFKGQGGRFLPLSPEGNAQMQKGNLMALNAKIRIRQAEAQKKAEILQNKTRELDELLAMDTKNLSKEEILQFKKKLEHINNEIKQLKEDIEKNNNQINELKILVNPAKAKAEEAFKAYDASPEAEETRNLKMARKLKELEKQGIYKTIDEAEQDSSLNEVLRPIRESTTASQFQPILNSENLNVELIDNRQRKLAEIVNNAVQTQARAETFSLQLEAHIQQLQTADPSTKPREEPTHREDGTTEARERPASAPAVMQTPAYTARSGTSPVGTDHSTQATRAEARSDTTAPRTAERQPELIVSTGVPTAASAAVVTPSEQMDLQQAAPRKAEEREMPHAEQPRAVATSSTASTQTPPTMPIAAATESPAPIEMGPTSITHETIATQHAEVKQLILKLTTTVAEAPPGGGIVVQSAPQAGQALPVHVMSAPNPRMATLINELKTLDQELGTMFKQLKPLPQVPTQPGQMATAPHLAQQAASTLHAPNQEKLEKQQEKARQLLMQAQAAKQEIEQLVAEETARRTGAPAAAQVAQAAAGGAKPAEEERQPQPAAAGAAQQSGDQQGGGGDQDRRQQQQAQARAKAENRQGEARVGEKAFAEGFTGKLETHQWGTTAHLIKTIGGQQFHVTLDFYGPVDENKINEYLKEKGSMEKIDRMMKEYAVFSKLGKKDFVLESTYSGGTQMRYTSKANAAKKATDLGYPEGYLKGKLERYDAKIAKAKMEPAHTVELRKLRKEKIEKLQNKQDKMRSILEQYRVLVLQKNPKNGRIEPVVTMLGQQGAPEAAAPAKQVKPEGPLPPPNVELNQSYKTQLEAHQSKLEEARKIAESAQLKQDEAKKAAEKKLLELINKLEIDDIHKIKGDINNRYELIQSLRLLVIQKKLVKENVDDFERILNQFENAQWDNSSMLQSNVRESTEIVHKLTDIQNRMKMAEDLVKKPGTNKEEFKNLTDYLAILNTQVSDQQRDFDKNKLYSKQLEVLNDFIALQQARERNQDVSALKAKFDSHSELHGIE